jgi:hypothetical protein
VAKPVPVKLQNFISMVKASGDFFQNNCIRPKDTQLSKKSLPDAKPPFQGLQRPAESGISIAN